ncbi:WD40 repeat-like protein [Fomitiporia mediterranea MF3/22]|uniref:WD40 repeat-like protein n=1 Tax=Fomitiporia mediterranea (strain MF3/22) TaxID=694068 RepID=UPI00044094B0|nr:WD40 repeat-like protein [Fomitiporia mediterranea MF3/22]EJC98345.1 WD40 repeat-like protein [Fomitiporia mediterranea MF3/22]
MRDAFNFVDEFDTLRDKTKRLESTIMQLLKQTNECCLFVQEYARHKFARRIFMLNAESTVDKFIDSLHTLRTSMDSGITAHIVFVSSRILGKVDVLHLKSQLSPDEMDAYHRPQCLPGTRAKIQNEIVEWASSTSDQNVFWLHGVAGSGKSTVSTTIAEHFRTISRLGAHLFFERGKSDPSTVIRTLAYRLTLFDSSVAKHVGMAVDQDKEVARATAAVQFESLLQGPLASASDAMQGPVVIILDALDECGSERTRRTLMESLQKGLPSLPKRFRILITSRKELDISRALSSLSDYILPVELEHDSSTCKNDVRRYLDYEMRTVFAKNELRIPADWQLRMDRLRDAAGGLFIWASTAVKLVDRDYPARRLNDLVSQLQSLSVLDSLYRIVLETSGISFDDEESRSHFSQVLGLILLCKIPLSDDAIDRILGYSDEESSRLVLSRLQSVIVYIPGAPIRPCHTSFRDYLLSSGREGDSWYIDLEAQKGSIAMQCFDVIKNGLRFNICNLESSYVPNDQVPDLPDRIKVNIPAHLEYACLFWSQHLHEARFSHALLNELSELLNSRLLYWLEVMSLSEKVNTASPALLNAMNWVSSKNADVLASLRDLRRMITVYLPAISHSTPHIYASVLPFASMESKFIARYLRRDLPTSPKALTRESRTAPVQIEQIGVKQQSPLLKELVGHTRDVLSVTFSPDGTSIASGSADGTVRIWDAESGQVIYDPFEEHTGLVQSVAFSPDGAHVVSASSDKTIRIWDVESGKEISEPLEGHNGPVYSVAFSLDGMHIASGSADMTVMVWDVKGGPSMCLKGHVDEVNCVAFSPDGRRIVSGSNDETIRVWDIASRRTICEPVKCHADRVWSVVFSPDGTRLASGSADNTIRIWDAKSGKRILEPFKGHTDVVNSVAFSPDGKHVVSGSRDTTVLIWDVQTGQVVSGPFGGHIDWVQSVAFSPDGTRVVSGSDDNTIRIWDTESARPASGPFEGHTDCVISVSFSPNGRHIASGSSDKSIRIWDAATGCTVSGPFEGHSEWVRSVTFSSDGRRVASGSEDCTIRVWDAESGKVVAGPFKGHTLSVTSVCISPDGKRVASGSDDRTVRLWDVKNGKMIFGPFKGHKNSVNSVAFSPDGRRVASGSVDTTSIIWDVESGEVVSGPLNGHTDRVLSVAFSSDGTRVASGSGDKTILIWNVESEQVVAGPFKGHTYGVTSVAFSPDGALVVSGSWDTTVRVWDVHSGQAIFAPFEGHTSEVRSVAFSPDGRHVVSGSVDRTIRLWNVEDPAFEWTLDGDGWIRGHGGELLLWIPPDLQSTLWRPRNKAVFSCPFSTKLDFTHAALGERWQECFLPPR